MNSPTSAPNFLWRSRRHIFTTYGNGVLFANEGQTSRPPTILRQRTVETKNGTVRRKHMGFGRIASQEERGINDSYEARMNVPVRAAQRNCDKAWKDPANQSIARNTMGSLAAVARYRCLSQTGSHAEEWNSVPVPKTIPGQPFECRPQNVSY